MQRAVAFAGNAVECGLRGGEQRAAAASRRPGPAARHRRATAAATTAATAIALRMAGSAAAANVSASSAEHSSTAELKNDLLLRAARGEQVERTPVWLFRQAGRHLPEYRAYKEQTGKNFLELLADPADVAEVTMQPVRRYAIDAAILFSDILVIPEAMGLAVEMPGGKGITVPQPIADPADLDARLALTIEVDSALKYVLDSVREIKRQLEGRVPLIGFSAAPWTLLFYIVGANSRSDPSDNAGTRWLSQYPEASARLLDSLTRIVSDYLVAQVDAGADIVQLFEAMGGYFDDAAFETSALPCIRQIVVNVKAARPSISVMAFARGKCSPHHLELLRDAGCDVVTLDTAVTDRAALRKRLGTAVGLQGNLDPRALIAREGAEQMLKDEVERMLREMGPQRMVANLGEGLGGKEDPALVKLFVDSVHQLSERIISGAKEF